MSPLTSFQVCIGLYTRSHAFTDTIVFGALGRSGCLICTHSVIRSPYAAMRSSRVGDDVIAKWTMAVSISLRPGVPSSKLDTVAG